MDVSDLIHEEEFVKNFVVSNKQDRYRDFLKNLKRRGSILNRWNHMFDFEPSRAIRIERLSSRELARLLRSRGAPDTAYVMGGSSNTDARAFRLEEAIGNGLASGWGTVISCVPGKLALLMQEYPPGDVFLLTTT